MIPKSTSKALSYWMKEHDRRAPYVARKMGLCDKTVRKHMTPGFRVPDKYTSQYAEVFEMEAEEFLEKG